MIPAIQRLGDRGGAAAERGVDLIRLRREGLGDLGRARRQGRTDFLSLFIERADHVAAAIAKRSGDLEGSAGQSLAEHACARNRVLDRHG